MLRKLGPQRSWLQALGSAEMFTVNTGLVAQLGGCLVTTNVIESAHSGARLRARRVCHWQNGKMVLRWALAPLMAGQNFRKLMGYRDLWMLKAALNQIQVASQQQVAQKESDRRSPPTILGALSCGPACICTCAGRGIEC